MRRTAGRPTSCFPRTRGDGPPSANWLRFRIRFPPHARGWTRRHDPGREDRRVSPARAGMDPRDSIRLSAGLSFPRTRGDGPSPPPRKRASDGFPPHARGWTQRRDLVRGFVAVSPARAGMDRSRISLELDWKRFPRTRGDGPSRTDFVPKAVRFPPHARGWTLMVNGPFNVWVVSPARAGMDRLRKATGDRDSRFPRTRGDGPCRLRSPTPRGPFPPHARGWTLTPRPVLGPDRVSPARAGMDPSHPAGPSSPRRFPRTRGDGPFLPLRAVRGFPFPPHARGWTLPAPARGARLPVSPARAGMDPIEERPSTHRAGFPRTRGDGP